MDCSTILFLLSTLIGSSTPPGVHPFHVSVAEMEYNPETKCLEVSLRVWPEDLEKALSQKTGKEIDLDNADKIDTLIFDYLKEKISVSPDGKKKCPLQWIGKEIEVKHAWLYFEVKTGSEPTDFYFGNSMFFELQDDQINLFNLNFKKRRASLSFSKDKSRQRLTEKSFAPRRNPFANPIK